MRIAGWGQAVFALASASLGLWSLAYSDFAWGGQSVLAQIPGREFWVNGSALIVLAASAGLCFTRTAVPSVLALGAYQAMGMAVALPGIVAAPLSFGAWYPLCEGLTVLAGAVILFALLQMSSSQRAGPAGGEGTVHTAQILFGLTCVFYGASHFAYASYTAAMVPSWLPAHLPLAYLTGLGHAAAGLAIMVRVSARLAAVLETLMMSAFGFLVWVPSFFAQPPPQWATPPEHQWSELSVNLVLAAAAWVVAISFDSKARLIRSSA